VFNGTKIVKIYDFLDYLIKGVGNSKILTDLLRAFKNPQNYMSDFCVNGIREIKLGKYRNESCIKSEQTKPKTNKYKYKYEYLTYTFVKREEPVSYYYNWKLDELVDNHSKNMNSDTFETTELLTEKTVMDKTIEPQLINVKTYEANELESKENIPANQSTKQDSSITSPQHSTPNKSNPNTPTDQNQQITEPTDPTEPTEPTEPPSLPATGGKRSSRRKKNNSRKSNNKKGGKSKSKKNHKKTHKRR
jgi:hypothetical protein